MASIIGSLFQISSVAGAVKSLFSTGGSTRIGDVVIDAALSEVVAYTSTITEHPIENKSAISDHIFKQPIKVKIEGYITDSPMKIMGLFSTPLQNNSLDSIASEIKSKLPFYASEKPSSQAYQALKTLFEERRLISLVTKLETFSDMAIESLNFTNNESTGGRLEFTADLIQIVYSKVITTNVKRSNTVLSRITENTSSQGNVNNSSEPLKSKLAGGLDAGSKFLGL